MQSVTAYRFEYINPIVWLRQKNITLACAQRIELENFEKMYWAVSKPVHINEVANQDPVQYKKLQNARKALMNAFYQRYPQNRYHASRVGAYRKEKFESLASKFNDMVEPLSKPWYEQLKEQEAQLSPQEKQKTAVERQAEFKEWQQANAAAQKRNQFFEEWRNNNPNYNKPDFNKI